MTVYTDSSKTARMNIGVSKWWKDPHGTFLYPPRFGKTAAAGIIIERLHSKKPDLTLLILVTAVIVKDQWIDFMKSELSTVEYDIYTPIEVDNLHVKGKLKEYDTVIVDEVHKFISQERYAILCEIKYKSILGLTGTYPSGKGKLMLDEICPVIDSISEKEALNNNWIAQFHEYNIPIELPDNDKEKYKLLSAPLKETLDIFKNTHKLFGLVQGREFFKNEYDVIQSCHSGKSVNGSFIAANKIRELLAARKEWNINLNLTNEYNKQLDEYWNPESIRVRVGNFNDFVRRRNMIHIEHPLKLELVIELFKMFPISTICFNESTDFADIIADKINILSMNSLNRVVAASYHSNIKSHPLVDATGDVILYKSGKRAGQPKMFGKEILRRSIIQNMIDKSLLFLSTARALDEGLNIPNLEMVITTAGTTNPITYTQRKSRGQTVDIYNPDKITKIINLYFDDFIDKDGVTHKSRDKTKLLQRQQNSNSEVKYIRDISDIL